MATKVHREWSLSSQRFLELQINVSNTGNQASSNWQVFSFPFISVNLSNPLSIYWLNAAVAKRNEGKIPINKFALVNPHLTTPWKSWGRVRLSHSKSQACSLILVLLKLPFVTFNLSCTKPPPHESGYFWKRIFSAFRSHETSESALNSCNCCFKNNRILVEGTSFDGFFVACVIPTVSALYCFRLDSLTSSPT